MKERTRDDHRLVVTKIVDVYNARYPALLGYQTELAKWMLATLSLINAGGLAALFNEDRIPRSAALWSAPAFAIGLALAVGCGLFSWINTNIAITVYDDIINPNAIVDVSSWKIVGDADPRHGHIRRLAYLAISSGVRSLIAAGVGCAVVWAHLA